MNWNIFLIILFIIFIIIIILLQHYTNFINVSFYVKKHGLKTGKNLFNFCYIFKEIFYDNDYNININLDNKIIFDIGMNMGIYDLWLNTHYKNIKVYGFEPIKELYDISKYNINKMKHNNNVFILNNIGLSNKEGSEIINYYPNANGISTIGNDIEYKINQLPFLKRNILKLISKNVKREKIKLEKASTYIKNNNIKRIDVCKIDVEGVECDIIKGFEEYINIVNTFIIEVEKFKEKEYKEILSYLSNFDIKVDDREKWGMIIAKNKKFIK